MLFAEGNGIRCELYLKYPWVTVLGYLIIIFLFFLLVFSN